MKSLEDHSEKMESSEDEYEFNMEPLIDILVSVKHPDDYPPMQDFRANQVHKKSPRDKPNDKDFPGAVSEWAESPGGTLKDICEASLCETITKENISERFILGHRYNMQTLLRSCTEFISLNFMLIDKRDLYKIIINQGQVMALVENLVWLIEDLHHSNKNNGQSREKKESSTDGSNDDDNDDNDTDANYEEDNSTINSDTEENWEAETYDIIP
ncbi:uncharacterized protein LOC106166920 [Lingula anatina]|uniref:Uncharacterized protein LOC106166920 n=1 Tax=Lingula anatina TaxID=7574 RepID=A0A1S3IS58_LINAN|nr:uncharacterized protein LOC106166920 [Lingula anatina]|eukprot:XP_013401037.1 uncharacterized protein LOC106166920 [Lingula anatina]